jgi:UDP-N-acetyl-D-glucosamine dehydrogenase
MSAQLESLLARVGTGPATVGIIGLGYVGLPLARAFSTAGFRVLGFDIDTAKVEKLNAGRSFIKQIPDETVAGMRAKGFAATDQFDRLNEPDAILICVPTPLTEAREPDLTYVVNSAHAIAGRLRPGQLVVLESTTYPSTTRGVMLPILERAGLTAGTDFFVAFSPSARTRATRRTPSATSRRWSEGWTTQRRRRVRSVHGDRAEGGAGEHAGGGGGVQDPGEHVPGGEHRAGERAEGAVRPDGHRRVGGDRRGEDQAVRVPGVLPGPGLGGHCIPLDPFYLSWIARQHGMTTRFIELAGEVNTAMPATSSPRWPTPSTTPARRSRGARSRSSAWRTRRTSTTRASRPSFELMDLLLKKGADVTYNDPHIPACRGCGTGRT